jgi:CheY-like chemotaxis protein
MLFPSDDPVILTEDVRHRLTRFAVPVEITWGALWSTATEPRRQRIERRNNTDMHRQYTTENDVRPPERRSGPVQPRAVVCIIEDVDSIRDLFGILLRKAGCTVFEFPSGEDACVWLSANRADLVLCDIMLPQMSGEDVVAYIRRTPSIARVPVVAVTALSSSTDRDRFLAKGFAGHISKPVPVGTFAQDVLRFVRTI